MIDVDVTWVMKIRAEVIKQMLTERGYLPTELELATYTLAVTNVKISDRLIDLENLRGPK